MRTGTVIGMLLFSCILAKPSSAQEWPDDIPYPEDFPEYTPGGPAGVTWNGNLDDIVDGFTATYTFGDFSMEKINYRWKCANVNTSGPGWQRSATSMLIERWTSFGSGPKDEITARGCDLVYDAHAASQINVHELTGDIETFGERYEIGFDFLPNGDLEQRRSGVKAKKQSRYSADGYKKFTELNSRSVRQTTLQQCDIPEHKQAFNVWGDFVGNNWSVSRKLFDLSLPPMLQEVLALNDSDAWPNWKLKPWKLDDGTIPVLHCQFGSYLTGTDAMVHFLTVLSDHSFIATMLTDNWPLTLPN